jgi:two-component system, chemotaxis family, protein-glutamate methylesterase/glutaminase
MWPSSSDPSRGKRGGRPPRCLVVDRSLEVVWQLQGQIARLVPGATFLPPGRDGQEALRCVRDHRPDLLFLDLEMPRMGGLTTLRALAGIRPARTVALAPETREGGRAAWEALGLGAIDFLPKREGKGRSSISLTERELEERLRVLLGFMVRTPGQHFVRLRTRAIRQGEIESLAALVVLVETRQLIKVARRLSRICGDLPIPLILDVPHPPRFTGAIAEGLDRMTCCPVRVAVSGERLAPGHIFLLPAGRHAFLRGEPGEVGLDLSPFRTRGLGTRWHRHSIRALLDPLGARCGLAIAGLPPAGLVATAHRAARAGRLLLLAPHGDQGGEPCLRSIERIGLPRLRKLA